MKVKNKIRLNKNSVTLDYDLYYALVQAAISLSNTLNPATEDLGYCFSNGSITCINVDAVCELAYLLDEYEKLLMP